MMKAKHTANRLLSLLLVLALAAGFMCIPGLAVSDEPEYAEEDYDSETAIDFEDEEGWGTEDIPEEKEVNTEDFPETEPEESELPADSAASAPQPLSAETLAAGDSVAGGAFSSGAAWDIYEAGDGTYELTISGEGEMDDYDTIDKQPWYKDYRTLISSVYVGDGITRIGKYAFASFTALVDVYIGTGVKEIGDRAFQGCSALSSIDIPYGVEIIGEYAFSSAALEEVSLPESVTTLCSNAFRSCTKMKSISLPDSVTSIGDYAFYNCTALTSITFPAQVTSLPLRVCSGCTALKSVTFLGDVEELGSQAFYQCSALTDITLPDTLETIGSSAFQVCTSLTGIVIPDSVTSIGDNCFNGCTKLASITLSGSIDTIARSTFYGCTALTGITIPASVTDIEHNAFYGCTKLASITFEGKAPSIYATAFTNVTATCYYYPGFTWSSDARANYGGKLTWERLADVIEITVSVDWEDDDTAADARPEEITVVIYANGEEEGTVVLSAATGWAYVFEEMPEYNLDGSLITYSVSVRFVNGYAYSEGEISYDEDGNIYIELIETVEPNSTSISFEIQWDDDDDRDGIRPEDSVALTIFADDEEHGTLTVTPDADGSWAGTFEDVPIYTEDGSRIEYTFTADADGYTCSHSADDSILTLTHEPALVNAGTGILDVSLEGEGDPPESVTVILYADGHILETLTLSEDNGWSGEFTDLYRYDNGEEIEYTLTIQGTDGYDLSVIQNTDASGRVSLAIAYEWNQISIVVTVVFADDEDRDGLRPAVEENAVEIALTVDGEYVCYGNVGPEEDWTYTFNVPERDENGNKIQYELTCTGLNNYDCEIDGYTIIFTHNPVTYDITVEKVWDDDNNRAGVRPDSVTVTLYANDTEAAAGEITAAGGWTYTFTDMPADENGENIVYSVEETYTDEHYYEKTQTVVGRDEEEDGVVYDPYSFILTNTYSADPTHDFTIYKYAADDSGNKIPLAGAEFTLQEAGTGETAWFSYSSASGAYAFSGWESGEGLTDTLVSGEDGYIALQTLPAGSYELTETTAPDGYDLLEEPVSISVDGNIDGTTVYVENSPTAPETGFYIYKYSDYGGVNGAEFAVTARDSSYAWFYADNGTYTFAGWNLDDDEDFDDEDGTYVEFIDTADNVGEDGLVYITGLEPGSYYVDEFIPPEGYIGLEDELLITLDGDGTVYYRFASSDEDPQTAPDGVIEVYNTPKTQDITVTAVWDDNDNRDGTRPGSLTVTVLANNSVVTSLVLNEKNGWTATLEDAAVLDGNGDVMRYTLSMEIVEGYSFTATSEKVGDSLIWTVTGTAASEESEEPEATPTPTPSESPEATPTPSETPETTPTPSETATPTTEPTETEKTDDSTASETPVPVPDTDDEEEPEASITVAVEGNSSVTITVTGLADIQQVIINDTILASGEDYTAEYTEDAGSGEWIWVITVSPDALAALDDADTLEITVTGRDADGETVEITATIEDTGLLFLLGDVNGDGVINISDVQALLKYVNGQDVFVIHPALDVNADGTVNISDVQLLLKYVNGQDVVLGVQPVPETQEAQYDEWSRSSSFMTEDGDLVEVIQRSDPDNAAEEYLAVYLNGEQIMACDTEYTTDPDGLIYYYQDTWSDNRLIYNYARGFVVVYDGDGSAIMATLDNYISRDNDA